MLDRLGQGKPLISDGAIGTMLMERGLKAGLPPEAFNLEKPEVLGEVAQLYVEAGSEIVHTNTFGGSSLKLTAHHLGDKVEAINRIGVEGARATVEDRAVISASVGPTGQVLKPYGDADPQEVLESFQQQVTILVEAGVDAITIETMTDLAEAKLAVQAARSVSSSIPVVATMTFDPTPRGFFTVFGVNIESAAKDLEQVGANVVGSNCGNGIEKMVEIAREFKKHSNLPVMIQSNAGLPELKDGKVFYPETPEFMAEKSKGLVELGVEIIGGCCGTTPEHIRALKYERK
jgi:5-methyltetrahydrofolate--homocysteine methyltransferase